VEQDQALQNHIHAENHREAITLALALNHPKRLLDLFTRVLETEPKERDQDSLSGKAGVDEVLATLGEEHLWTLLRRLRDWNASARTSRVAQRILFILLHLYPKDKFIHLRKKRAGGKKRELTEEELIEGVENLALTREEERSNKGEGVKEVVEGLKVYTERHKTRLEKMAEEKWVLDWTLRQMEV